jgi:hypothetical protein
MRDRILSRVEFLRDVPSALESTKTGPVVWPRMGALPMCFFLSINIGVWKPGKKVLLICLQCLLSAMRILLPHELMASKLSLLTSIQGIFAHCVAINK